MSALPATTAQIGFITKLQDRAAWRLELDTSREHFESLSGRRTDADWARIEAEVAAQMTAITTDATSLTKTEASALIDTLKAL